MQLNQAHIPRAFQPDIERAARILKEAGCSQVFVFGSLISGHARQASDIDLAVRGCPEGRYFALLGKLLLELEHPVDLVLLDRNDPFSRYREESQELLQVA